MHKTFVRSALLSRALFRSAVFIRPTDVARPLAPSRGTRVCVSHVRTILLIVISTLVPGRATLSRRPVRCTRGRRRRRELLPKISRLIFTAPGTCALRRGRRRARNFLRKTLRAPPNSLTFNAVLSSSPGPLPRAPASRGAFEARAE